jgi:glyoxylase-like metal-dependent hydrolase (beta-lactamase superfamily II)
MRIALVSRFVAGIAAALSFLSAPAGLTAQTVAPIEYYRLVPGFLPEAFGDDGMARGTGFATPNPWGAYTAYLLSTNAKGQRTWRIENYLPNPTAGTAQGSTMYLFEGNARALLIDTAQNTTDVPGQPDLKAVVRHLLGHQDDEATKATALDFVVANTHSHGDHTGKNALMSDRTVYYPDLDWPRNAAPPNYVPIKEGGGSTTHGTGQAVSEIDLGGRTLVAIDIHEHTPGSTGYLDRENKMVATGDAIGSGYVWAHFGSITQYAQSVHHLQDVLRPFDHVDVLPAHFYQVKQNARGKPPLNGRPLDKRYVDDEVRIADSILDGTVVGEPYRSVGRNAAIATIDSGQVVYTLGNLYLGGLYESTGDKSKYHAMAIPRLSSGPPSTDARYTAVEQIKSGFYLIRDFANNSMFLIVGSTRALLVGTGSGTPGIAAFVKTLAGAVPIDVIVTSDDDSQVGGLAQFIGNTMYLPEGVDAPAGATKVSRVTTGSQIHLGVDRASRPLVIEVHRLWGHSTTGLTLLDATQRVLLTGDALGSQGNDAGLILHDTLASFSRVLAAWRAETDGKYDVVYTAHNYQWLTSPAYVNEVQSAVTKGLSDGDAALVDSTRMPGMKMIRSSGAPDVVASVMVEIK